MIKEQLFLQSALDGINRLINDLSKKYIPKKGGRFKVDDITYEIGSPRLDNKGISFEISSKIPIEKIDEKGKIKAYFTSVKKIMLDGQHKPRSVSMENIIKNTEKNEEKTRDYVKVDYLYKYNEIYDENDLAKKLSSLKKDASMSNKVSQVTGATTIAGKLILFLIRENIYNHCNGNIDELIAANKKVKKELKIK